jgi:hypothetical protein
MNIQSIYLHLSAISASYGVWCSLANDERTLAQTIEIYERHVTATVQRDGQAWAMVVSDDLGRRQSSLAFQDIDGLDAALQAVFGYPQDADTIPLEVA